MRSQAEVALWQHQPSISFRSSRELRTFLAGVYRYALRPDAYAGLPTGIHPAGPADGLR